MQQENATLCYRDGRRSTLPFVAVGIAAILLGGLIAAAVAHEPSRNMVWMVAYLVLVAGLAQIAFGLGQIVLADKTIGTVLVVSEFLLFNLGNAGVISGTITETLIPVAIGTALLLFGLGLFLYGSRGQGHTRLRGGYRVLLAIIAIGALVGLTLSALSSLG